MNLTYVFIFFIAATIIIDFLTYKKDIDEIDEKRTNRIISNHISTIFTYVLLTFTFSLVFRYFLVGKEYLSCTSDCSVIITNTLVGVIVSIIQIINIYNFYDNYIYSYRFLAKYSNFIDKFLVALMTLTAILFNEFILSFIRLNVLTFDTSILDFLSRIIISSTYIFMPLLIIIRELFNFWHMREKDD